MATGDIDIVVQSLGSNPFRPFGTAGIDTEFYERAKKLRNLDRKLLSISCGADADLGPNLKELMTEIEKATGGQMQRIGALCLFGDSNGSGLILALAKALQQRGARRANYIGLGDSTLMPFGRNPPVPGIGNLQPINRPQISLGLDAVSGINIVGVLVAKGLPPSVSDGEPPRIANPGVEADSLENYFTKEGNRARVFSSCPAGSSNWWWTSTMNFGEVHGEVLGWKNIPRTTISDGTILLRGPGSIDDGHHVNLCKIAMAAMRHEAGLALGKFVTALP